MYSKNRKGNATMSFLSLPYRIQRPRDYGLNIVMDTGSSSVYFEDVMTSHSELIDLVKFGWGSCLVTNEIDRKISCLMNLGIPFFFGGTLFEKAVLQDKVKEFKQFCLVKGCKFVELSNGTIDLSNKKKAEYIDYFIDDFMVLTEVGYKETEKSKLMYPAQWIEYINQDLDAGAYKVITESRESGTSGICRENGELRFGLIEEIIGSGIDINKIIFESPNKQMQTYFVSKVGSNVNLANLALDDIVSQETIRLGLRSDSLFMFEGF